MITEAIAPPGFIRIGHYDSCTELLGEGKRFALWVQGCRRRCTGCIAEEMQSTGGGRVTGIDKLAGIITAAFRENDLNGITISGGEPFLQADKLCELLRLIDTAAGRHTGTVIYTGYTIETLKSAGDSNAERLLNEYTDVLIDGEYIETLNDDRGLRGSSNQRVIYLTELYRGYKPYEVPQKRKSRLTADSHTMYMTGVPSRAAASMVRAFVKK